VSNKTVPFSKEMLDSLVKEYPTPFHIYDGDAIRENARNLNKAFAWLAETKGSRKPYKNYFAVKALPNPSIMSLLREEGLGFDCSSLAELELCKKIGVTGSDVFFTSNNTKLEEYKKAYELGAVVNLDDYTHLEFLKNSIGLPEQICFRYNPGPLRDGNGIIGKPEEAKYGLTKDQLFEAYAYASKNGVKSFGLHTMIASNELNIEYFFETAKMLFELALEIYKTLGIKISFINLGGGVGIPYTPEQNPIDLFKLGQGIKEVYQNTFANTALEDISVFSENGRVISGPYGYLVSKAIHEKHIYREYIGLDACMANLMRPGMYGAYHHITVLGKEEAPCDQVYDVVGSLCENNDKFAVQRALPKIDKGDYVIIHDTGAHGHAMGFNYNGKLRSAEFLLEKSQFKLIRRAETLEDLFATLNF